MEPNRLLLRIEEVGELLGISRSKTWALIASGELKSIKIGASRRVPMVAVHQFVEAIDPDASSGRR